MKIIEAWKTHSAVYLSEDEAAVNVYPEGVYDEGYTLVDDYGSTHGFYADYFEAERTLCQREGGICISPNFVCIHDADGEIVCWDEEEWLDDPTLAVNIANAVRMYYTKGPAHMREILGKVLESNEESRSSHHTARHKPRRRRPR